MKMLSGKLMATPRWFINFLEKNRIIRLMICTMLIAVSAIGLFWPCPATASPDPGVVSGSTITLTGDQHLGITSVELDPRVPPDFSTQTIDTLVIKMLSQNIDPYAVYPYYDTSIFMIFSGKDGPSGGSNAGPGENGKNLTIQYDGGNFTLKGGEYEAAFLASIGGRGGDATSSDKDGHAGGAGGNGGNLSFTSTSGDIEDSNLYSAGISLESSGQDGGKGEEHQTGVASTGGTGGAGGNGGSITVDNSSKITVSGRGILADSIGGNGNTGGVGDSPGGTGGKGGNGGAAGPITITNRAAVTTTGTSDDNQGIYAVSEAGNGGKGGNSSGMAGNGGAGGAGGAAGQVKVTNLAAINTAGYQSQGILAQSVGGAGGDGGSGSGLLGDGGATQQGGIGGKVIVDSSGTITTTGEASEGVFAQSVGGFAGDAGASHGLVTYGANDQSGGAGGEVDVSNEGTVTTSGKYSDAVFAQSVGGGGGAGSSSTGLFFSMGGTGSAGGAGGTVNVNNTGTLKTTNDNANGVFAQSLGGGGGAGGEAGSIGVGFSIALGGKGGKGGNGGQVNINPPANAAGAVSNSIDTSGDNACGIFAQSAGGGGGNGGYAVSAAAGPSFTTSISIGGSGASGGAGGVVSVASQSTIHTRGENAYGIFAESLGGGGGVGGFSVSTTASIAASHNISFGGSGGDGGGVDSTHTQKVTVTNGGNITTDGVNADGILAQSVGGGGGAGGFSATGSLSATRNTSFSLGGTGGGGGTGGEVDVTNNSGIATSGKMASGILAQSVGGGGGDGGFSLNMSAAPIQGGISLGGSGDKDKGGGNGGYVKVINNAGITTGSTSMVCGDSNTCKNPDADPDLCSCGLSYGILAQSVGGGGGKGGYSFTGGIGIGAFDFSLGGAGSKGGYGGLVDVTNYGGIETYANGSHGILAQSLGGGGGAGGAATSVAMTFAFSVEDIPIPSAGFTMAVGGKGGGGGGADSTHTQKVTVNNYNGILTKGEGSAGILAQSVGGGGGDGGWAAAGAGSISEGETISVNVAVALGGTGGSGGKGGEVQVNNSGTTQTMAKNSPGILAQSVGGGGGDGGLSAAVTIAASSEESASMSAAVSVGGSGGSGGAASQVSVTSSKPVTTQGDSSYGINAQSIGGGGGNGGASITGTLGLTKSKETYQMQVSVGGSGDNGGAAGLVNVNTTGGVATQGDQAVGILAQSIGGGGGNGGMSFNGQLTMNADKNFAVSIGGTGKGGGNGNSVTVASSGPVTTSGMDAHGILAQSVGGGGGTGGLGGSGTFAFRNSEEESINLSVNVGGAGGTGGTGSTVSVNNHSDITTAGDTAYGILAQSIGGGGGDAGGGFTGHINTEMPESGTSWELGVTIGGKGGSGKNGGNVQVTNQGKIKTTGDTADGIFAQSVGGGGGAGGDAKDFVLDISEPAVLPEAISSLSIGVGGNGGGSSPGGNVTINNTGAITTEGEYSKGILAQSIGGGGGKGGSNIGSEYSQRTTVVPNTITISLGGSGSGSSNGGIVNVTNSATITTLGEGSDAIFAQSVGAGGGLGGEGELGLLKPGIAVGGGAGAGGLGGAVTVTNSGVISTSGDGANGIFAQSVGGGGGRAGDVARFDIGSASIGLGIGFARSGGAGGDGGAVTVNNTANITTHGMSAYGILAQSVGGGGGEAGEVGIGPGAVITYLMGSVGGPGYGGTVTVNHSVGTITTLGEKSCGIFAQSAGGDKTGGAVDVTTGSNVLVNGAKSDGIVGQSIGKVGNGDVAINVTSGTVQGGAGGSGVAFMDGAFNTLVNHGTVTTLDGINGAAVVSRIGTGGTGLPGNETINNYENIIGSVDLGGGTNTFHNYMGSSYTSGPKIYLGTGNLFTNEGTINPGGSQKLMSLLTGNFTQTASGDFLVSADGNGCSQLQVSGTASLGGSMELAYGATPFTSTKTYNILTANAVQNTFAQDNTVPSPLLTVSTAYSPKAVAVTITPQSFATVAQSSRQVKQGQYLDEMLFLADPDFNIALAQFQALPDSEIKSAFTSLGPGLYDADTFTTFSISRQYARTVEERLDKVRRAIVSGETRVNGEKSLPASNDSAAGTGSSSGGSSKDKRFWASVDGFGNFGDADETGGLSGFDYTIGGLAANFDYALSDHTVVGAGYGYSRTQMDMDTAGSGDIDSFHGSLYGTYFVEKAYLEGILTYGTHYYDNSRKVDIGTIQGNTESNHDADAYSALLEGGLNYFSGDWAMQPYASLFYSYLDEESFEEAGAGSLNMHVDDSQTNDLASELGVRVSRPIKMSKGILTPVVKAAWQYDYDVDRHTNTASFTGAPFKLSLDGRERPSGALFGAGFSFACDCGVIASVGYNGEVAEDYTANAVFGQISIPF